MCGIYLSISNAGHKSLDNVARQNLMKRGPDAWKSVDVTCKAATSSTTWYLTLAASVLALRGCRVEPQPLIDDSSSCVLCWNGEAWTYDSQELRGNDTLQIFKYFVEASINDKIRHEALITAMRSICGPYAFVFYDAIHSRVYYARDVLGRRSLLLENHDAASLTVCSISTDVVSPVVSEVPTDAIHCIDLQSNELKIERLDREIRLPQINKCLPDTSHSESHVNATEIVAQTTENLREALRLRVQDIPTYTVQANQYNPSKVAVLFSGGLDCTLLARLAHDVLPLDQPIDLINVAFENPRVARASGITASPVHESCPDRITGRSSFHELTQVCPTREWRFVAVDVPFTEFKLHRATIVKLMHPHNTEMDLSITAALYFAARGEGVVVSSSSPGRVSTAYTTTARVLLSGLGADELFGGYTRHATAFERGSHAALINELQLDFKRIGTRNLGRDDRVIAHWGKESRYPFLDEAFVAFTLSLPVWQKCGFHDQPKTSIDHNISHEDTNDTSRDLDPAKILLRRIAWGLGMTKVANEKKRAIQFGARTAKMIGGKSKGTDIVTADDVL